MNVKGYLLIVEGAPSRWFGSTPHERNEMEDVMWDAIHAGADKVELHVVREPSGQEEVR